MMTVQVGGKDYSDIKSVTVNASLEEATRSFSFTTIGDSFKDLPFRTRYQVKIFADGFPLLFGNIERIAYDAASKIFTISGRSTTADLIDSTIDHRVQFKSRKGRKSLQSVAETLISYLFFREPIADFPTIAPTVFDPDFLDFREDRFIPGVIVAEEIDEYRDDEDLEEEPGQTYFEVLEKFARKRQVMVTTNGNGDLVFTRGKGAGATPFKILHSRKNPQNNNVKAMTVEYDNSLRYNLYDSTSQPAKGGLTEITDITPEGLIVAGNRVIDAGVRISRKMFFIAENSSNEFECRNRALWEAIQAISKYLRYEVTVQGHSYGNNVWDSNVGVDVVDDFADINGRLLVSSVRLSDSVDGGAITNLVCRIPGAYTFPEKPLDQFLADQFRYLPSGFF